MSTRSATIVRQKTYLSKNEYDSEELFRFYRHCDGYPEGHGLQMAMAFRKAIDEGTADKDRWITCGLNNRNWVQKCFAALFAEDCDLEVEAFGHEHWDIEYLYVVEGAYDEYGGKHNVDDFDVRIIVYEARDDGYEAIMRGEPIFDGGCREFIEKYGC